MPVSPPATTPFLARQALNGRCKPSAFADPAFANPSIAVFGAQAGLARNQPAEANATRNQYIIQIVATEQIDELVEEARQGRRIFLDASALKEDDSAAFNLVNSHFRMTRTAPALYELEPL